MRTQLCPPAVVGTNRFLAVLVGIVAVVVRLGAAQGAAPPESRPIVVDFEYHAPAECITEKRAFSLLKRRSRRVVRAHGGQSSQQLNMIVMAEDSGYRGVLVVQRAGHAKERRAMTGANCEEVVEALALTAALSLDPHATLTLGPSEEGADGSEEEREELTESSVEEGSGLDSKSRLQFGVGISLTIQKLMDQAMHLGGGVSLALSGRSERTLFPLEAQVSVHVLTQEEAESQPSIFTYFVLSRWRYCPLRVGGEQSLLLCPFSQLGAVVAQGRGFQEDDRVTRLMMTLGMEAWLRARLSRKWSFWLSPSVAVPLTKRRFAVQPGVEVLASTLDVAWGVSTGLGWAF